MKIGICSELFQGWPVEKIFDYAARLGYQGVEIAPFSIADSVRDISPEKRKTIRRAAEERKIAIVGLHWLLAKPEGLSINHPEAAIRKKTEAYLKDLIHFCADLGGNPFPWVSKAKNCSGGVEFCGSLDEGPGDF